MPYIPSGLWKRIVVYLLAKAEDGLDSKVDEILDDVYGNKIQ